ncbi:MAG: STAS domain-containing protein [Planctomycetota bacterium]
MALLRTQEIDGVLVVRFQESKILDEVKIQEIGSELLQAAGAATGKRLVLNFSGVDFMSSAMIGKLVLLNKKCKAEGVTLKLSNISDSVAEVFEIMKLSKIFDMYKTEEKAVKAFDSKGWFS